MKEIITMCGPEYYYVVLLLLLYYYYYYYVYVVAEPTAGYALNGQCHAVVRRARGRGGRRAGGAKVRPL
jgi:hypothetical protein